MISDITLGQYFPAKSPMHRTDPRMKICLTVFAIVLIFVARNFLSLAVSVLFIGVGMACSKIPLKLYLKSLKPCLLYTSLSEKESIALVSAGQMRKFIVCLEYFGCSLLGICAIILRIFLTSGW